MTRLYRVAPEAQRDLDRIWDYIAADNPHAATRFVERIVDKFVMLARQPFGGEARPELATDIRSFPVGDYVLFYVPITKGDVAIEIVRVLHGARDIQRLF